MAGLRAIETAYRGYRFRSRTEARWAVFFDALGVTYEYEAQGFDLGDAGKYLPDFWLPAQRYWVEIKGVAPDKPERLKAAFLAERSGCQVVTFWGKVQINPFFFYSPTDDRWTEDTSWGGMVFCPTDWDRRFFIGGHSSWPVWEMCSACDRPFVDTECRAPGIPRPCGHDENSATMRDPRIEAALLAARQARFEFGENGNRL